jgi:hypothetical protein
MKKKIIFSVKVLLTIALAIAFGFLHQKMMQVSRDKKELILQHQADSAFSANLVKEYDKIMAILSKGLSTKDSVYFVDKDKTTYLIQFIKK